MKKILMAIIVSLVFLIISDVTIASAVSNENTKFEHGTGAAKHVEKIDKEIVRKFGSLKRFEDVGGLYFDDKGIAHIGVKNRTSESAELVDNIGDVAGDRYVELEEVTYSTTELDNLKESILEDIESSLSDEE